MLEERYFSACSSFSCSFFRNSLVINGVTSLWEGRKWRKILKGKEMGAAHKKSRWWLWCWRLKLPRNWIEEMVLFSKMCFFFKKRQCWDTNSLVDLVRMKWMGPRSYGFRAMALFIKEEHIQTFDLSNIVDTYYIIRSVNRWIIYCVMTVIRDKLR